MCELVGQAVQHAISRRALLRNTGVMAAAGVAFGGIGPATARATTPPSPARNGRGSRKRTRLVMLGTAGGPSVYPDRAGISSAVVVEEAVYLVDLGHSVQTRFVQAGLGTPTRPGNRAFEGLQAIFLTHLHSDHTIEYPAFRVTGMWNGLDNPARPVQVYGTVKMSGYLDEAYANDLNDRLRSSGGADPRRVFQVHDIALPAGVPVPVNTNPMPPVAPFPVYEDARVKVTATLVNHAPVFPSFAFRFDTDDGSITFSGDTSPSDNLVQLAQGTDVLVHEIIDRAWVEALFPPPRTPATEALVGHLLESHTTIEDLGPVAQRARAKLTVLTHIVPVNNPQSRWLQAQRGYSGKLVVGQDLMEIGVGARKWAA